MSYMKSYAMWCQEQGYLDENFQETNPNDDSMRHAVSYTHLTLPTNREV